MSDLNQWSHSVIESRRQLQEGEKGRCVLDGDSFSQLILEHFRYLGLVSGAIGNRSNFAAGEVHKFSNSILNDISNVNGRRGSCPARTESVGFLQEALFKQME